jgi:hypothetical protein
LLPTFSANLPALPDAMAQGQSSIPLALQLIDVRSNIFPAAFAIASGRCGGGRFLRRLFCTIRRAAAPSFLVNY